MDVHGHSKSRSMNVFLLTPWTRYHTVGNQCRRKGHINWADNQEPVLLEYKSSSFTICQVPQIYNAGASQYGPR